MSLNTALGSTAVGGFALQVGTTAVGNTAVGFKALAANTADSNTAVGFQALQGNTIGIENTAVGTDALFNTTGPGNIAIGANAGLNVTNGSAISRSAAPALQPTIWSFESAAVRHKHLSPGFSGATSSGGVPVLVNSRAQLGASTPSRRFKHAIADMGVESDLLMKLRPVSFYYKPELDQTQRRQYGLVAEEVAQVAPDVVVLDKDGQPQAVRYHFVNATLLNEVQKQRRTIQQQQAEIEDLTDCASREARGLDHAQAGSSPR